MDVIPTALSLTTYDGGPEDFMATPLEELIERSRQAPCISTSVKFSSR
jgi:hypothetical protein